MKTIEIMHRARFVKQGSKMVLVIDLSQLDSEDARKVATRGEDIIKRMPKKSVLTLANFANTSPSDELEECAKQLLEHSKPHVLKGAVTGFAGRQLQAYWDKLSSSAENNFESFESYEDALHWLVDSKAA
jgi:hypothetical protein